jgi:hypothetical protein
VTSADDAGPDSSRIKELLEAKNNDAKKLGLVGSFLVFLDLEDSGKTYRRSFPISLGETFFQPESATPWLVELKAAINDGLANC